MLAVDFIENGEVKTVSKEECEFKYIKSAFQLMENVLVIGALFQFEKKGVLDICSIETACDWHVEYSCVAEPPVRKS